MRQEREPSWDQLKKMKKIPVIQTKNGHKKNSQYRFENASVWARSGGMMSFLRSSINSLKQSANAFKVELQSIREDFIHFRNDNDHRMESLEKSVSYVSDKFENWRDEKAVLLSQIAEMKTEYKSKFDDIEQYSRRSCLILTGIKERKGENTDNLVLNALSTHLGIKLDLLCLPLCSNIQTFNIFIQFNHFVRATLFGQLKIGQLFFGQLNLAN